MKRLAAILLSLILLVNTAGYKLLFSYLETRAGLSMQEKINSGNYLVPELQEVIIPLELPYINDRTADHIAGEVEVGGRFVNMVKYQIKDNRLHIWYLHNNTKDGIAAARKASDAGQGTHQPSTTKNRTINVGGLFEYLPVSLNNTVPDPEISFHRNAPVNQAHYTQFQPGAIDLPPESGVC